MWKTNGYKKLLVSSGSTSGMDKIPIQDQHENAMEGDMELDKKMKMNLGVKIYQFLCWKSGVWSSKECKECRIS